MRIQTWWGSQSEGWKLFLLSVVILGLVCPVSTGLIIVAFTNRFATTPMPTRLPLESLKAPAQAWSSMGWVEVSGTDVQAKDWIEPLEYSSGDVIRHTIVLIQPRSDSNANGSIQRVRVRKPAGWAFVGMDEGPQPSEVGSNDVIWRDVPTHEGEARIVYRAIVNASMNASHCCSNSEAHPGSEITFKVRIENPGKVPLTDVLLSYHFSPDMEYVKGSTQVVNGEIVLASPPDSWLSTGINLGTIAPEQSAFVTLRGSIRPGAPYGRTIENVIQTRSNELLNWRQCAVQIMVKPQ